MSLIEAFPQLGGGAWNGGPVGNPTTFNAEVDHDGPVTFGAQTFSASGTATAAGNPLITLTGTTSGQTLTLPASPIAGQVLTIVNEGTQSWTVSGNGHNLDGAASVTLSAGQSGTIWYDGTTTLWQSTGTPSWRGINFTGGTVNTSGGFVVGQFLQFTAQTASAASVTITRSSAVLVNSTYSTTGAQTITLPSNAYPGEVFIVIDGGGAAATHNITVSGNGNNINGASTYVLSTNYGVARLWFSGSAWFVI